jgi:hypothetical protein
VVDELRDAFRLAFSDLAEVAEELTLDAEFSDSDDVLLLLDVAAAVFELPLVVLLDDPPLAAVSVSVELPPVAEVAPPPVALFVCAELPDDAAAELPRRTVGVEVVAPVALVDEVLLLVLAFVPDALSVSEDDLTLLELCARFAEAARVADNDALEVLVRLFVLEALWLSVWFNEALRVLVELLVRELVDDLLVSVWLFLPRL